MGCAGSEVRGAEGGPYFIPKTDGRVGGLGATRSGARHRRSSGGGAQESAGGGLRAPSTAAHGQQTAEAGLGPIAGGRAILLSVDQLEGDLEPRSGAGVVPFTLAD